MGKVYFDVTDESPDTVVYNSAGDDLLIWKPAPAIQPSPNGRPPPRVAQVPKPLRPRRLRRRVARALRVPPKIKSILPGAARPSGDARLLSDGPDSRATSRMRLPPCV